MKPAGGAWMLVTGALLAWAGAAIAPLCAAERAAGNLADGRFHSVSQPAPGTAPAAPLDQPLTPPATRPRGPSAPQPNAQARSFGASRGPQSSAPSMIGDFFGNGSLQVLLQAPDVKINTNIPGFAFSPNFSDPAIPIFFTTDPNGPPVLTATPGRDVTGDGFLDTWDANNVPPQFLPPPPGPGTITLDNGSVVAFTQGTDMAVDGNPQRDGPNIQPGFGLLLNSTFRPSPVVINAPNPGGGGGVGRLKIAENNSPLPRDRVFHNYSFFHNVPLTTTGVDVNRFIPGFEKTFFGGAASIEMRFPFAATLDSVIIANGVPDTGEVEFGNIGIPFKVLLAQNDRWAWSIGMQVALPTADDTQVQLANGTPLVRIENESVHLMPFLGILHTPSERLFAQAFVQFDADANGNPVQVTNFNGGLAPAGTLDDVTYLFVDLSVGYWLRRSDYSSGLTGVAPTLELHINRALDDAPVLQNGGLLVNGTVGTLDSTNLVIGTMFEWSQNSTLTLGYATPVTDDRQFDGELRVIFNRRFGPQTRASRAQF